MIQQNPSAFFVDLFLQTLPLMDLNIKVSETAIFNMVKHMDLLIKWAGKFNLTSINNPEKIVVAHFLDSLTIFNVWEPRENDFLLDVGTGAGFPGLVLKSTVESFKLTLLDKSPKKMIFLKVVSKELGISDISFVNKTLQDYFSEEPRTLFDVICFRALPKKNRIFIEPHKFLKHNGSIIEMYSKSPEQSKKPFPGFKEIQRWSGKLPLFNFGRTVIRFQRI
jgi:16S rRNA (guanine527-N7)-methyltransferase